jgi:Fe-S-cluster containining protein
MDRTTHLHILADRLLPTMGCDKGCDFCCTIAPASQSEYDKVLAYAAEHGIKPRVQGVLCPWFQGGRCTVHPVRPLVCRVFGHAPDLRCPRGHTRLAPVATLVHLRQAHRRLCPTPGRARYLHDICCTRPQIEALLQQLEDEERV